MSTSSSSVGTRATRSAHIASPRIRACRKPSARCCSGLAFGGSGGSTIPAYRAARIFAIASKSEKRRRTSCTPSCGWPADASVSSRYCVCDESRPSATSSGSHTRTVTVGRGVGFVFGIAVQVAQLVVDGDSERRLCDCAAERDC